MDYFVFKPFVVLVPAKMKRLAGPLLVFAFLAAQAADAQNTPVVTGKASGEAPVDPQKVEVIRRIITASGGLRAKGCQIGMARLTPS